MAKFIDIKFKEDEQEWKTQDLTCIGKKHYFMFTMKLAERTVITNTRKNSYRLRELRLLKKNRDAKESK